MNCLPRGVPRPPQNRSVVMSIVISQFGGEKIQKNANGRAKEALQAH